MRQFVCVTDDGTYRFRTDGGGDLTGEGEDMEGVVNEMRQHVVEAHPEGTKFDWDHKRQVVVMITDSTVPHGATRDVVTASTEGHRTKDDLPEDHDEQTEAEAEGEGSDDEAFQAYGEGGVGGERGAIPTSPGAQEKEQSAWGNATMSAEVEKHKNCAW